MELLGIGPRALPVEALSDEALARRIAATLDDRAFSDRAKSLSLRAASRDGVAAAVEYLEPATSAVDLY